ncbi:hypothetical protein DC498_11020 [Terrimonas sp.]|uniref:hypothetical protein n=1 Tax=Terrimonas sp. TaxID=1914338 RepID=UPI000D520E2E|nr:hypothetical protein [Terrimonas sp.]PVD52247.1 hypothetical protein DC498_11020 [Terrimonas sp.]
MTKTSLTIIGIFLVLIGCSTISKFDQYAYSQTTAIKVDALNVMSHATDSFVLHADEVARVQTEIDKIYEYEKNRPKNMISEKMWVLLKDSTGHLFGGFVSRWKKDGKLDDVFVKESQIVIGASFDQISQLESGKIKPQQVTN